MPDHQISKTQLKIIETSLDKIFNKLGLDVSFSGHFLDRLNDPRNRQQITVNELVSVYNSLYEKFGIQLSHEAKSVEEVIKSLSTDINIPIRIQYNRKTKMIDLLAKTVMRKKNFMSTSPVLTVESFKDFIIRKYK